MRKRLPLLLSALVLGLSGITAPEIHAAGTGSASATQEGPALAAAKPAAPSNLVIYADKSNHRKCSASWSAPTVDAQKNPIDTATVTYNVYLLDNLTRTRTPITTGQKGTTCNIEYTKPGYDVFFVLVESVNSVGKSSVTRSTQQIFLGDAKTGGLNESWADGQGAEPLIEVFEKGNGSWYATAEARFDFTGCDNDHGYLSAVSYKVGNQALMATNYLDLSEFSSPMCSFHVYRFPTKCNLKVDVMHVVDSVETVLKSFNVKDMPLLAHIAEADGQNVKFSL